MDRHRTDKRRKAPRSLVRSVWVPAFAAILVLYVIFVIKVQNYATTTASTANTIGGAPGAAFDAGVKKHAHVNDREMKEDTVGKDTPAPAMAQAAKVTTAPPRVETIPPRQEEIPIESIAKETATPPPTTASPTIPPPVTPAPVQNIMKTTAPVATEPAAAVEIAKPVLPPVVDGVTMPPEVPATEPVVTTMAPVTTSAPVATAAVVYDQKDALGDRHDTLSGYDQTVDYLAAYEPAPGESLFLFFTCSDKHFNAHDWSPECVDATKKIYDVFAKSPPGNRLVTIYAGSEKFWKYQNKFRNDRDLRIKAVPCLMKWHGNGGETSGMMITDTLTEEPFLRYLFKNTDQPDKFLNAAATVGTKSIETVSSHDDYLAKLEAYKLEAKPRRPLYLLFISGRLAENNRPWCPYCRFSEMPMEYGFYAFAPPNARLLRVEVAATYQEWKTPNKYNRDPSLGPLRGVPGFYTVQQLASGALKFDRIYERFDQLAALQALYRTAARVHDE